MAGAGAGTAIAAIAAASTNIDIDFNEELSMVVGLGILWRKRFTTRRVDETKVER